MAATISGDFISVESVAAPTGTNVRVRGENGVLAPLESSGEVTLLAISEFSPAAGALSRRTPIEFDVFGGEAVLAECLVSIEFGGTGIREVAYGGGGLAAFGPMYTNVSNTKTAIEGGFHFSVLRDGGWLPSEMSVFVEPSTEEV